MFFHPPVMDVAMRIVNPLFADYLKDNPLHAPCYHTEGAAGIDLRACVATKTTLYPGDKFCVGSGIAVHIADPNACAILLPRSSLGMSNLMLANTVGLIDSDFQGEIKMLLFNHGDSVYHIQPFERLVQMVFLPIIRVKPVSVTDFEAVTERGSGGFGSTGTF